MSFWRDHMPDGMLLRSASDWHLDVAGVATIESFLAGRGTTPAAAEPLSRDLYLAYVEWFAAQKQLEPVPLHVSRLDRDGRRRAAGDAGGRQHGDGPVGRAGAGDGCAPAGPGGAGGAAAARQLAAQPGRGRPRGRGRSSLPARRRPAERVRVGGAARRGRCRRRRRRAPARHPGVRRLRLVVDRADRRPHGRRPRLVRPADRRRAGRPAGPALGRGPAQARAVARRPAAAVGGAGPTADVAHHRAPAARRRGRGDVRRR